MRLLIAGSRDLWPSLAEIDDALAELMRHPGAGPISCVVTGGARGVDRCGDRWARARGHLPIVIAADWWLWGRSAGIRRNAEMAGMIDAALVWWDGSSRGTMDMIARILSLGCPRVIRR